MHVHIGPQIRLPTRHGDFDVVHVIVQDNADGVGSAVREGVALRGLVARSPLLVRVQSSCLFSESFWATDCDCALQLQASLERVAAEGGLVLYFYEEGRGAGLSAKFKAIELQQVYAYDTRAAYECLKMKIDGRSYEAAAAVLRKLLDGQDVCLLSNNRDKERDLAAHGVRIVARERLVCGADKPAVRRYLSEKRSLFDHDIPVLDGE